MHFMNSSLDALVQNLADNDFKHLSQEFSSELLELVKQKRAYPYEYMGRIKAFLMISCLTDANFLVL